MDDNPTAGDAASVRPSPQPVLQPGVIEEAIAAADACERACAAHVAEAHGDEQAGLAMIQDTAEVCRAVVSVLSRWTPDTGRHVDLLVESCAVACRSSAEIADGGSGVADACQTCRSALLVLLSASHAQEP